MGAAGQGFCAGSTFFLSLRAVKDLSDHVYGHDIISDYKTSMDMR